MQCHWFAVIQHENDRLARRQHGLSKHTLRFGQIHRGSITNVVSSPRLTTKQYVFPKGKNYEIRLLGNFNRFGNQSLIIFQGRKLDFIDITPVRIGITCIIECDLAPLSMHYPGRVSQTFTDSLKQRHCLQWSS